MYTKEDLELLGQKEKVWPEGINRPANAKQMQHLHEEGERRVCTHQHPNRATRRAEGKDDEFRIMNNRPKTKGRQNNNVVNRMAYFGMQMANYRMGLRKTGEGKARA